MCHVISFMIFGLSIILGSIFFTHGCDPSIKPGCDTTNTIQVNTSVSGRAILFVTCTKCTGRDEDGDCEQIDYFTCYNGYLITTYEYNGATKQCRITTNRFDTYENTNFTIYQYQNGDIIRLYIKVGDFSCHLDDPGDRPNVKSMRAGLAFFVVAGVILLIYIIGGIVLLVRNGGSAAN